VIREQRLQNEIAANQAVFLRSDPDLVSLLDQRNPGWRDAKNGRRSMAPPALAHRHGHPERITQTSPASEAKLIAAPRGSQREWYSKTTV
jgi:hypothetical protein